MRSIARCLLAVGVLTVGATGSARAIDTNIRGYVCEKLDDFVATGVIERQDQRELSKIGRDIGVAYRFREISIKYKEPNKVRMDGRLQDGTKGVVVWNGTSQIVSVPKLRLVQRRELGNSPGKRKSLIDVGLVSDYYLTYVNARYLREARVDGATCAVFDMTYKDRDEDSSHHILYIDPQTKVVRKREAYSQDGKLQAIYHFKDVKEIKSGVWFPTRIQVQNTDMVIAAETAYKDIKVNTDMSDTVFKI